MYELAEGDTKVMVLLALLVLEQLWQTFCEPLQYLNIRKVAVHTSAMPLVTACPFLPAALSCLHALPYARLCLL
jgi:hypothetical protein